ncbi:MAG: TonB-dependent siderophore receptor [Betaproteobacteria bacterium HGW-Betaproteobacteria-11]|nr:MAG: TonB-dependent siderophore receptor [Betaproteobacteria bacterium HGW-Betaproteobacteria-11]
MKKLSGFSPRPLPLLLSILFPALSASTVLAGENTLRADAVVVTATRNEQSAFDLPVSIDSVNQSQIQDGQLQVNLSESLARIPGINAQNRQNYAQDLQISSRGFGARASFGVRGLRLYADGIPATMPDGQGQVSNFDLGSAARLEVMRGPFSSLYGSSAGGVIALFTEDGAPGATVTPSVTFGSYGTQRIGTKLSGDNGTLNYVADLSTFRTDGYRDHSAAKRTTLNTKFGWKPDADSKITLVLNSVDMPEVQDPLGLTRAQFTADPRQAVANALAFNTRKNIAQTQLGLAYERKVGAGDTLNLMLYRGQRDATQYQSIPTGPQANPLHPGGVIDLTREYWGIDTHWSHRGELAGAPLTATVGLAYDNLDEARKGFRNFIGSQLGVMGALRRNEDNHIFNFDQYAQLQWEPSEHWLVLAGVRNSQVKVSSKDHYIVGTNGDDSGSTDFSATLPVLGITWRLQPALNLYASFGKGFETPTMNELSYRPDGSPGLNFALQPAKSDHYEVGAKALLGEATSLNLALFNVHTSNEIVVAGSSGGRTTYRNGGGTQRSGLELSLGTRWASGFGLAAAYTNLDARYKDTISGTSIRSGNAIPGIPRQSVFVEGSWQHQPSGFSSALELRHLAKVYVNDANSDAAPAYTIASLRLGFEQKSAGWMLKEFVRVDNLSDKKYAGSVIVNESNSRFFEPAPGRNWLAGVSASYHF